VLFIFLPPFFVGWEKLAFASFFCFQISFPIMLINSLKVVYNFLEAAYSSSFLIVFLALNQLTVLFNPSSKSKIVFFQRILKVALI